MRRRGALALKPEATVIMAMHTSTQSAIYYVRGKLAAACIPKYGININERQLKSASATKRGVFESPTNLCAKSSVIGLALPASGIEIST